MSLNFADLRSGYAVDWARMVVDVGRTGDVDRAARRILSVRRRFETVAAATGVPWFVIGLLLLRESDLDFGTHLHNGDSLKRRTTHVPAGRPKQPDPPYSWEESAIDALRYDGLTKIADWTLERVCFQAEAYNGFGPRGHGRRSGYLWAGCNVYDGGKYVEDGVWDPDHRDTQLGVLPVLHRLAEIDEGVAAALKAGGAVATRTPTLADAHASLPAAASTTKAAVGTGIVAAVPASGHSAVAVGLVVGVVIVIAVVSTILVHRRHARLVAAVNAPEA